jgi:hypothetical protein
VKNTGSTPIPLATAFTVGYSTGLGYGTMDNTCAPGASLAAGTCCAFTVAKTGAQGPDRVQLLTASFTDNPGWDLAFSP